MKLARKIVFTCLISLVLLGLVAGAVVAIVNANVINGVKDRVLQADQAAFLTDVDCILVLGCRVDAQGNPSHMLEDRIKRGVELYEKGTAPKLLMSGDHGQDSYDEVNAMKSYAVAAGVPSADVFMDHAGFSTYESIYRAKAVFGAKKIVIVTQTYHLYRALHIAEGLGLEAYGVDADYRQYSGQTVRDVREVLARCKDFMMVQFKPNPTYLGEEIPITGNGDVTND